MAAAQQPGKRRLLVEEWPLLPWQPPINPATVDRNERTTPRHKALAREVFASQWRHYAAVVLQASFGGYAMRHPTAW